MPFGRHSPAKSEMIKNMYGEIVKVDTPDGYVGLFWGAVYNSKGKKISEAEDHFCSLSARDNGDDDLKYCDEIADAIYNHCEKYIKPYCGKTKYGYQSGFGGNYCNGLVDFWTEKLIPEMPDMEFEIAGKKYTIKWEYSSGDN